jgi:alpha-glucosidase
MKKTVQLFLLFIIGFNSSVASAQTSYMIGKRVAIFYPADFNKKGNLPSFALTKEAKMMGAIPTNWKMRPYFYHLSNRSCAAIPLKKGTSLYGTGEVTGSLLRNGKEITLWNTDNYNYLTDNGKRLYQSHPWVLGVNADGTAFGVIADNTWKQHINLGDSIKFSSEGPAFRVIIIERNSPQEVLQELSNLVGKMQMPPLWALGYQQSRYSYEPDSRAKEVADEFRKRQIPCDVIWFDIDYMERFKIFTFDKTKFPDPKGMNDYLHNKGFKGIWMVDPGVKVEKGYSVYESGLTGNHYVKTNDGKDFIGKVWPGDCSFPDFTRPETQQWWGNLYKDYMATGIDGVWNDMNEPAVFDSPDHTMPEDNWHRGGGDLPADIHLRYHNVYGALMIKSSLAGILKIRPEKRPFILSRSGFLGSHRYGATWTGDNKGSFEDLKLSIPMVLNLGLSGQGFSGPDIGGFADSTSAELFGHWIALGAFYPFSRGHAAIKTNDKEPWAFGKEVEDASRTALNRRYRLMPYLYTLFHEAATTGMPIMRPLFFADTKDTSLRREEQSFLLGDNLMIIPKWATSTKQPKGNWRLISINGEMSQHDHFQPDIRQREGSILPIGNLIQNTTKYQTDSLTLSIVLDKNGKASGTLYEDAGEGFGYKKGEFAVWTFSATTKGKTILVSALKTKGNLSEKPKTFKLRLISDIKATETKWLKNKILSIQLE